jgi:Holliday junction resolvase-like predicted endonuclease
MEKLQQKHKGAHSELRAVLWLLERGYDVYRNVSQCGIGDLVAARGDEIMIIDVKSALIMTGGRYARSDISREQAARGIKCLNVYTDGHIDLDMNPPTTLERIPCVGCGKSFFPTSKANKFCNGYKCRRLAKAKSPDYALKNGEKAGTEADFFRIKRPWRMFPERS